MQHIDHIQELLDEASKLADDASVDETRASDPFTALAQLIDSALASAERIQERIAHAPRDR